MPIILNGKYFMPARYGVKLNRYGNISKSMMQKILTSDDYEVIPKWRLSQINLSHIGLKSKEVWR